MEKRAISLFGLDYQDKTTKQVKPPSEEKPHFAYKERTSDDSKYLIPVQWLRTTHSMKPPLLCHNRPAVAFAERTGRRIVTSDSTFMCHQCFAEKKKSISPGEMFVIHPEEKGLLTVTTQTWAYPTCAGCRVKYAEVVRDRLPVTNIPFCGECSGEMQDCSIPERQLVMVVPNDAIRR